MTVCHCVGCAPGLASYRLGRRQDMCMCVCALGKYRIMLPPPQAAVAAAITPHICRSLSD